MFRSRWGKSTGLILSVSGLLICQADIHAENPAREEVLVVDEQIPGTISLNFSDEDKLEPKISEFRIVSSLLMSSRSGERWATVTIKNLSSHQRLLDSKHLVAIFANGKKRNPAPVAHNFSGDEEVTLVINFGKSKFPLLKVFTRN